MKTNIRSLACIGMIAGVVGLPSLGAAQNVTPPSYDVTPRFRNVTPPSYDVTPPRVDVSPIPPPTFRRRQSPSIAPGLIVPRPGHRPHYIPVPNYYYWGSQDYYYWGYPGGYSWGYPSTWDYQFGW